MVILQTQQYSPDLHIFVVLREIGVFKQYLLMGFIFIQYMQIKSKVSTEIIIY